MDILQFISGQYSSPSPTSPHCALQDLGKEVSPSWAPATVVQCVAAVLAGCTTSLITNPLDLVRTRVQVTTSSPFLFTSFLLSGPQTEHPDTIRTLWVSERMKIFQKGLTARMTSSSIYSLAVIFGYESVKKLSVLPQYKQLVAW